MKKMHPGFALPLALVVVVVSSIVITGVISYTSYSSRMTALYTGKTRCRLAAESALELVRKKVYDSFQRFVSGSTMGSAKVYITPKSESAFKWFTDANSRYLLGSGNSKFDLRDFESVPINGCTVRPRVAHVQRCSGGVIVTYMCTATYRHGTTETSVTMCERAQYGVARSAVFNNAYFVNNFGWFEGTGLIANGDVRANGNMALDSESKINGNVYAAANPELGVSGTITNYGTMDKRTQYQNATYGTVKRSRPLTPAAGGYDAPDTVTTATCKARCFPQVGDPVVMPWISDLNSYAAQGVEDGSSLKQGSKTYIDASTQGVYTGVGPSGEEWFYKDSSGKYVPVKETKQGNKTVVSSYSGDTNLTKVRPADYGVLVLEGTKQNPIQLNGPVVVSNDVIISGYVTGQGTIYSSRNIHIVGDIEYVNPPQWDKRTQAGQNGDKDLLGLAAQGNIVLGDYTDDSDWMNKIKRVLSTSPYVQPYECDEGDAAIGYPRTGRGEKKFCGDYTQLDDGEKIVKKTERIQTGMKTTSEWGSYYDNKGKKKTGWHDVETPIYEDVTYYTNEKSRHYYDSVVYPTIISNKAKGNKIQNLDCVMYNNHGLFGRVQNCTVNGALVCRNEGIMYKNQWILNWDYRLFSGSSETVSNTALGLPVGQSIPYPLNCQEVPNSWNDD